VVEEAVVKAIYMSARAGDGPAGGVGRWSVKSAMTSPVLCVRADATLAAALRVMVGAGRRHLVVVDDANVCVGVVADRVLAAAWAHEPDTMDTVPLSTVLDPEPATVGENARLVDAARAMRSAGVDAVAVLDADRHPIGVVTGSDLVAVLAR